MSNDPIVIVSIARTPIGKMLGELKGFSATELGAAVIKELLKRANLTANQVNEVILGCVLSAGLGQAPARQAALKAGIPANVPCTTINKVCGSGMKAIMFAHDLIRTEHAKTVIAGGMESMTNAPYLLKKARQGYRLGQDVLYDHLMLDGLLDAYENKPMGDYADTCASNFKCSRENQDAYAQHSFDKAKNATESNFFANEIVPLHLKTKHGDVTIDKDEHPFSVNPDKIPTLKAAFRKNGTVTAGNSSSIADGAAGVILMPLSFAQSLGIKPLARIIGHSSVARSPDEFTIAPIDAVSKLLKQLNWQVSDVDLFEINEAFAIVVLAFMQSLSVTADKINIHGGACALGHPIGASGARIVVTLISALQQKKLKRGIASLCIAGGEATAIAIEIDY